MDLRRYLKVVHGPIHDPSIKLLSQLNYISPFHKELEERQAATKRKREEDQSKSDTQASYLQSPCPQPPCPQLSICSDIVQQMKEPLKKRGCYNEYSPEVRQAVGEFVEVYGVPSAVKCFAAHNNGKGIPERTSESIHFTCFSNSIVRKIVVDWKSKHVFKQRGGSTVRYGKEIDEELQKLIAVFDKNNVIK